MPEIFNVKIILAVGEEHLVEIRQMNLDNKDDLIFSLISYLRVHFLRLPVSDLQSTGLVVEAVATRYQFSESP